MLSALISGLDNGEPQVTRGKGYARPHRLSDRTTCGSKRQSEARMVYGCQRADSLTESASIHHLNIGDGSSRPEGRVIGKKQLSDRYVAGLLDADGCFGFYPRTRDPNTFDAVISFTSTTPGMCKWVAHSLTPPSVDRLWGHIAYTEDRGTWSWRVQGKRAVSVCMRLHKYLVSSKLQAQALIGLNGTGDVERWRAACDAAPPMPNHPSVPWVAGYIDGNGCFSAAAKNGYRAAYCQLIVSAQKGRRAVALELLQKAYGGSYNSEGGAMRWVVTLPASKIRSMFESGKGNIGKHMVIKRRQMRYLLGASLDGHLRPKEVIVPTVKQLNQTHPHRLSDGGDNEVASLLNVLSDSRSRS